MVFKLTKIFSGIHEKGLGWVMTCWCCSLNFVFLKAPLPPAKHRGKYICKICIKHVTIPFKENDIMEYEYDYDGNETYIIKSYDIVDEEV